MSRAGAIERRNRDWGKGEERKGGGDWDWAGGDGLGEIKGCKFYRECNWNFLEQ